MFEIISVDTPSLGDRSYLAHDGEVALVVDAQRDIDRMLGLAARLQVRITHVFETHIHNDYVTGGLALAQAAGAAYYVNADDPVAFDRVPAADGDVIEVSRALAVRVLATPGHTFTHLSYALTCDGAAAGVFTGGSLLYGSTGRPDLLGPGHSGALVAAQYRSAHRLAAELPDAAAALPTHGFGSFCSATQSEATSSTIGEQKRLNPALTRDERRFARRNPGRTGRLAGVLRPHGARQPRRAGRRGPDPAAAGQPCRAAAADRGRRVGGRPARPPGVRRPGTSRARSASGWTAHSPPTSAGSSRGARRSPCSARHPARSPRRSVNWSASASTAPPPPPPAAPRSGQAAGPGAAAGRQPRGAGGRPRPGRGRGAGCAAESGMGRRPRRRGGAHPAARAARPDRRGPPGQVWVYCQAGYRAALAASLLAAAGREVVTVDDEFGGAGRSGLPLDRHEEAVA